MGLFKSSKDSRPQTLNCPSPSQSSSQPPPSTNIKQSSPPPYAYAPPPEPPPPSLNTNTNPPPYHNWQSLVPDNSTLPPPPSFAATHPNLGSTHNAAYSAAAHAHKFCRLNPPFTPSIPAAKIHAAALSGRVGLVASNEFQGKVELKATGAGKFGEIWHVQSTRNCPDSNLMSTLPLYFARKDSPALTGAAKTVYYELRVLSMRGDDAAIAIGFAGRPYPGWRLPGWHRGSVGVHGDDGRRFVNDSWGGIEFVGAFREGEVVGLGLNFVMREDGEGRYRGEVFFSRDGKEEGRWWVDEERDAERDEGGVEGLLGEGDLYVCVGCFGQVEFEVVIEKRAWLYKEDGL